MRGMPWTLAVVVWCTAGVIAAAEPPTGAKTAGRAAAPAKTTTADGRPLSPAGPGDPLQPLLDWAEKRLDELEKQQTEFEVQLAGIRKDREAKAKEIRDLTSGIDYARDPEWARLGRTIADLQQQEQAFAAKRRQLGKQVDDELRKGFGTKINELRWLRDEANRAKADRERVLGIQSRPALKELYRQLDDLDAKAKAATDQREADRRKAQKYQEQLVPQKVEAGDPRKETELIVPPPADAVLRQQRFAARNSPAALAALGQRFAQSLDLATPGLESVKTLAEQKKYAAVLDAYRTYFIEKMRDPGHYNVPEQAIARMMLVRRELPQPWLDDALHGIFRVDFAGEMLRANVGLPGAMVWCYVTDDYLLPSLDNKLLEFYRAFGRPAIQNGLGLRILLDGYLATGDPAYLRQWCAALDDWCLNWRADLERFPDNVRSYDVQVARDLTQLLAQLRVTLCLYDPSAEDFPASTLARVLLLALEEYNTAVIRAKRSMIAGGTARGLEFVVRNCSIVPEFRLSHWALGEVQKLAERECTFTMAPDGGSRDFSDAGRPGVWGATYAMILPLLHKLQPSWFTPAWEQEFLERYQQNLRFFVRNLKQDGHRLQADYRSLEKVIHGDTDDPDDRPALDSQAPALLDEPEVARVLDTVFGDGSKGAPQHLDDALPYHVSLNQRRSWQRDDLFAYLRALRLNGNVDEDVCGLKLWGFGQLLLNAPPIYVDGVSQNSHYGLVENPGGPAAFLVFDDGRPGKGLWHSSPWFGLMEGIYEGSYEETGNRPYWTPFLDNGTDIPVQSAGQGAITNVARHSRQVFFLRRQGIWIVVDRLQSKAAHEYQQHYQLYNPVRRSDWYLRKLIPLPKNTPRVVFNQEQGFIVAQGAGLPSMTICQAASAPLRYAFRQGDGISNNDIAKLTGAELQKAETAWRNAGHGVGWQMAFNRQVTASFKGQGPQVLVAAILPRESNVAGDLKSVKRITGQDEQVGLRFDCPDGSRVTLLAANGKALELRGGSIAAVAETLLTISTGKNAPLRGMVAGCTRFSLDGSEQRLAAPDFEFATGGEAKDVTLAMSPYYRPIQPVTIAPEATIFVGTQSVELACATPGVQIRYTLDGTDPKPDSPLYTAPLKLTESAEVRAIALRPGVKNIPWVIDGTRVTFSARAAFTRLVPRQGRSDVNRQQLQPGLNYEYLEGGALELFASADSAETLQKGAVPRLFDVSMRHTAKEFAVRYRGYLDLPQSGVYVFYAPREFWFPSIDAGYDLRLSIDGEEWYPSTRRHGLGTWSAALAAGLHEFQCTFVDTRRKDGKVETWHDFPAPEAQWQGAAPQLLVAGPDLKKQPLPDAWLLHEPQPAWTDPRLAQAAPPSRTAGDIYAGLMVRWDLAKAQDGRLVDVSAHGLDARIFGGTIVDGPRGKMLRFAERDAGLVVDKSSHLLEGDRDFTLIFRAKVADDSSGFLMVKSRRWKQDGWGWSGQGAFEAFKGSSAGDIHMQPPQDDEPWRCLILTYRAEDRSVRIYNNGKLAGYGELKSLPGTNEAPWRIGTNLKGEIDEIRVYSRAFTRDEISRATEELKPVRRSAAVGGK